MSLQQEKALLIYFLQSLATSGNVSKQSTPGAKTVIIEAQAWLRLGDRGAASLLKVTMPGKWMPGDLDITVGGGGEVQTELSLAQGRGR